MNVVGICSKMFGFTSSGRRSLRVVHPYLVSQRGSRILQSSEHETAIPSVTSPGPIIDKRPSKAAALARQLNEYCAKLRNENLSGYGFFAPVPSLQDIELCFDGDRIRFRYTSS